MGQISTTLRNHAGTPGAVVFCLVLLRRRAPVLESRGHPVLRAVLLKLRFESFCARSTGRPRALPIVLCSQVARARTPSGSPLGVQGALGPSLLCYVPSSSCSDAERVAAWSTGRPLGPLSCYVLVARARTPGGSLLGVQGALWGPPIVLCSSSSCSDAERSVCPRGGPVQGARGRIG